MTITDILSGLLDRDALSCVLGVGERSIRRYEREADGLPYIVIGRRHYYRQQAVAEWMQRRERQHNPRKRRRAA